MLPIRFPELIHSRTERLYLFNSVFPVPRPPRPLAIFDLLLTISDLLTSQIHVVQPTIMEYFPTIKKNEVDVYTPLGKWWYSNSKQDTALCTECSHLYFLKKHMYIHRHFLEVYQEKCQQLPLRWRLEGLEWEGDLTFHRIPSHHWIASHTVQYLITGARYLFQLRSTWILSTCHN